MMDVSVIVVNYNTADIITSCINSILMQKNITYEIIVVDNASADSSIEVLKKIDFSGKLIAGDKNVGFGSGCNIGFRQAKGRFILILNPDAKLRQDNDIRRMADYMDSHPKCGMMGPSVIKDSGRLAPPHYDYPGEHYPGHLLKGLAGDIAWIIGACIMIPRKVYESVGGFDEDYFLYAEEADLALRIRKKGLTISYYPDVAIDHIGGASETRIPTKETRLRRQNGKHLFFKKHYSKDQIESIVRGRIARARRKLFFLRIYSILGTLSGKRKERIVRNQIIIETSRAFLHELTDHKGLDTI
ncbi:MAG: glycosyltransferase family 2 protein [Deltaproteobacteria bacterium]|nr:glycosyltransferase family 2 protein [Candidatus Zymogenaceae bacterium]